MKFSGLKEKIVPSLVLAIPSGAVGYVCKEVLASWGALDGISRALGGWLKLHVTPGEAGWLLALISALTLYGGALWFNLRGHARKHHEPEPQVDGRPSSAPEAPPSKGPTEHQRALIARARDLAHNYNAYNRSENFHAFAQRQRIYYDLDAYFSLKYRRSINASDSTVRSGPSPECQAFLEEIARLESLWGLRT